MTYLSSSEFVSSGHPDRLADNIAAALIQKIQEKDGPCSHAAVEVFITKDTIIFGGEVTTTLEITDELLRECVVTAYDYSGYLRRMRKHWTKEQVALAEDMIIVNKLAPQSPDIALGTTDMGVNSGYNDQGVFFSSADCSTRTRMGLPMQIATDIGGFLSGQSRRMICDGSESGVILGPDNKVVVTVEMQDNGFWPASDKAIKAITIAVAHTDMDPDLVCKEVKAKVEGYLQLKAHEYHTGVADDCVWVINGTGKFVVHGAASDTSMTGRKISVNHPSAGPVWANKMIGGGSLVKPWHASDFLLNVACRFIANVVVEAGVAHYAVVGCGCAIGQKQPQSLFVYSDCGMNNKIAEFFKSKDLSPRALAEFFGFWDRSFNFFKIVDSNFFGDEACQPWESRSKIEYVAKQLLDYLKLE